MSDSARFSRALRELRDMLNSPAGSDAIAGVPFDAETLAKIFAPIDSAHIAARIYTPTRETALARWTFDVFNTDDTCVPRTVCRVIVVATSTDEELAAGKLAAKELRDGETLGRGARFTTSTKWGSDADVPR